ncbi:MAG: QueT transporter family protein [Oscillospiraceae bacterium]|nr:QueT transporter family protein [Oscillospiraceae bacterium]
MNNKSKIISKQAMIAAMYVVLGMVFAPVSFGSVQARISEALTLLPVFGFTNVWGVTIGCFITNLIGLFTGANILGSLDIIFGTAATFIAAVMTWMLGKIRIRNLPLLAVIPPVIVNAAVVGWELCIMINGGFNAVIFFAQAASVALGQLLSCGVLGLLVVKIIDNNPQLKDIIKK